MGDNTSDFTKVLDVIENRYQAALDHDRRWLNERKIIILWNFWLLPWMRQTNDTGYESWKAWKKKSMPTREMIRLVDSETPYRMKRMEYLRSVKWGAMVITSRGVRCAYEYALRAVVLDGGERPGQMLLRPRPGEHGYNHLSEYRTLLQVYDK